MSGVIIRTVNSNWPRYNRQIRQVVSAMTDEQLALTPHPSVGRSGLVPLDHEGDELASKSEPADNGSG